MPTIDVDGATLHYVDTESGNDVVLLLHAFPLNSGMWSRQIAALAPRYRVVAPDYPGLGKSAPRAEATTMDSLAARLLALLASAHVERATVVGLSMGGYVALELYRQRPALFRGLVLCDTRAVPDTPEAAAARQTFAENAIEKGLEWVADQMTPPLLRPEPADAEVREVRRLIGEGTPAGVAAAQRGMALRPDSRPTLSTISCPTLVVVGAEDTLIAPVESERMAAAVKGAKLSKIPGAGHLPNIETPRAYNELLLDFVDSV